MSPDAFAGEAIGRDVTFDAAGIAEFARRCGDPNPLHHDAEAAARSPYGGIIACGPHVTALFMALSAELMTRLGANAGGRQGVGLGFSFTLRRAVRAGDACRMRWRVTGVERRPGLRGDVVLLEGEVLRPGDELAVAGRGEALLMG